LNLGNNFGVNVHQDRKKQGTGSGAPNEKNAKKQNGPAVNIIRSKKQMNSNPDPNTKHQKMDSNQRKTQNQARSQEEMKIRFTPR